MRQCDDMQVLLATRKDVSPAQEQQLSAHLAQCSTCTAAWQAEERVSRALRGLPMAHPQLAEQVVEMADQRIQRALLRGMGWPLALSRRGLVLGATLLLAICLVGLLPYASQLLAGDIETSPVGGIPGSATLTPSPAAQTTLPTAQPTTAHTPLNERPNSAETPSPKLRLEGEQAVRQIVEEFGRQLQHVALLAPREMLALTMQEHYAAFVSADLLERWINDPLLAPGRQTSSPWPDRIEIVTVEQLGETRYLVRGDIVEVTSTDRGKAAGKRPIQLIVERGQERWLITEYQAEPGGRAGQPDEGSATLAPQTIFDYYRALDERAYDQAYRLWQKHGAASGQNFAEFQQGYQSTVRVNVILDATRLLPTEPRAVELDVRVLAVVNDPSVPQVGQRAQIFRGTYTLEPAGPGEQSATGWVIASAAIEEVADPLPPAELETAEQVLVTYYEAINRQSYVLAYSMWELFGAASGQSFADFQQGFATTAEVALEQGTAQTSAGAGSVYTRIPVVVRATQTDGSRQTYCGFYNLRRANTPPFDQLGWHIQRAELVATDPAPPNSAESRKLLAGGCPAQ